MKFLQHFKKALLLGMILSCGATIYSGNVAQAHRRWINTERYACPEKNLEKYVGLKNRPELIDHLKNTRCGYFCLLMSWLEFGEDSEAYIGDLKKSFDEMDDIYKQINSRRRRRYDPRFCALAADMPRRFSNFKEIFSNLNVDNINKYINVDLCIENPDSILSEYIDVDENSPKEVREESQEKINEFMESLEEYFSFWDSVFKVVKE